MEREFYINRYCKKCLAEKGIHMRTYLVGGLEMCMYHGEQGIATRGALTKMIEVPEDTVLTLEEFAREIERD